MSVLLTVAASAREPVPVRRSSGEREPSAVLARGEPVLRLPRPVFLDLKPGSACGGLGVVDRKPGLAPSAPVASLGPSVASDPELGTASREPGVADREGETADQERGAGDPEPGAVDHEAGAARRLRALADPEPVATDLEPVATDLEPVAARRLLVAVDPEPWIDDSELGAADPEPVSGLGEPVSARGDLWRPIWKLWRLEGTWGGGGEPGAALGNLGRRW